MMNSSVSCLSLSRCFQSPFIADNNRFKLFSSSFRFSFYPILYSQRLDTIQISHCKFGNFLSSCLHISQNNMFYGKIYLKNWDFSLIGGCDIINCIFDSCKSQKDGGGLYFNDLNSNFSVIKCLFVNCSCSEFGGSYCIRGKFISVNRTCSNRCYHTVIDNYINGGGGFLYTNFQANGDFNVITECSPLDIDSGHCCFAFFNGKQQTTNTNVSKCHGYTFSGYFHYLSVHAVCKYSSFDNFKDCYNSLMVYYTNTATFDYCNLVNNSVSKGALYSDSAPIAVTNFCFFGNTQDTFLQNGGAITLSYCYSSLASGFNMMNNGLGNSFGHVSYSPHVYPYLENVFCNAEFFKNLLLPTNNKKMSINIQGNLLVILLNQ